MTYDWQINPGDTVKVFASPEIVYVGVVRSMPQATGDAWVIENEKGVITYQQTYNRIIRISRGDNDAR